MKINKSDCVIETMRGTGPGGQNRNKLETAVRITHVPTGISAYCDERTQNTSKRKAWKALEDRIEEFIRSERAADKKAKRDHAIHNTKTIRTYHQPRQTVKDHRNKKTASWTDVVDKGKIDLLR